MAKITDSDRELMLAVGAGRLELMETLFSRHQLRMYRFFRRSVRQRDRCEDLVQNLFLRMIKHRRSYRGTAEFTTWMYRIALNLRADYLRQARRDSRDVDLGELEETPVALEGDPKREQLAQLRAALGGLRRDDRETLTLVKFEGLSYAEVAAIRGCSVGALKVRVHRALRRLRRLHHEMKSVKERQ